MEREAGHESVLAWLQAGEPDTCDRDQPRLLRDDLDVTERPEHGDILPGEPQDRGWGRVEECLERPLAARVPEVLADQPRAALGAVPDRRELSRRHGGRIVCAGSSR